MFTERLNGKKLPYFNPKHLVLLKSNFMSDIYKSDISSLGSWAPILVMLDRDKDKVESKTDNYVL